MMNNHARKKRFAIVGTGARSGMYIRAAVGTYAPHAELVGLCDASPTRMNYWNQVVADDFGHPPLPTYTDAQFDQMVRETKPDVVIVTTVDSAHHQYIVRALELGCDAVTEKPMTTDADKARAIFDAVDRTGGHVTVTFNYRYMPVFTKLREIILSGEIGEPTLVDFQWHLDTSHGADYFRRWHREKSKSGGLLVHKATHHFDLVNFWVGSTPKTVFAMGDTRFYGKANAEARGETYGYDRYTGEPAARDDPFCVGLVEQDKHPRGAKADKKRYKALYYDAEHEPYGFGDEGYIRDRNVFSDKWPLDAEDTMAVCARYRNGVILSYSLIAYCPWEGERVSIQGTKGRLEYFARGEGHIISGQTDEELGQQQHQAEQVLRIQKMFEPPVELEIPTAAGGHGGGDARILDQIYLPDPPADPFNRSATHIDGAASLMMGLAANEAIRTGRAVDVDELLGLPQVR
jgi:predicted dehydrogenase